MHIIQWLALLRHGDVWNGFGVGCAVREGTSMKRFKKLAAGMVAAGMALAMLPVAAAQADDYFLRVW